MKRIILYSLLLTLGITTIVSCKKDNYKPPTLVLSGSVTYKGEPLQFQFNQVGYQLYQYGFGLLGPINDVFGQDGTYSSLLFAGDYKLTVPNGSVPFKWPQTSAGNPDSLSFNLTASKTMDIEVVPYYMIRTPQLSAAAGKVNANFKVEKIILDATGKDIDEVVLFVNKTQYVSNDNSGQISNVRLSGGSITDPNNITLTATIPSIVPTQNYVYARVGLKISGLNSWIFSPVQKLTL